MNYSTRIRSNHVLKRSFSFEILIVGSHWDCEEESFVILCIGEEFIWIIESLIIIYSGKVDHYSLY